MPDRILFEGQTKQGKHYMIRYTKEGDAPAMCAYINVLSQEKTFITYQGEQMSEEEETKYVQKQLQKIEEKQAVQLLVVCDDVVMGISGIDLQKRVESHIGVFGISLSKELRGEGIGTILMRLVIEEAEKNLSGLRLITLGVFGNNELAQRMYAQKFGFKEYGRLPEGILHLGKYVDHIYMYKKVN